MGLIGIDV